MSEIFLRVKKEECINGFVDLCLKQLFPFLIASVSLNKTKGDQHFSDISPIFVSFFFVSFCGSRCSGEYRMAS